MNNHRRQSLALGLLFLLSFTGCGGSGMSDAHMQSLGTFIDDLDQMYTDGDAALASGNTEQILAFVLEMNKKQLDLVDAQIANKYPTEIQAHIVAMKGALSNAITIQSSWIKAGTNRDSAPADEVAHLDDQMMVITETETALRIAADR
jgi:hypothetical protein